MSQPGANAQAQGLILYTSPLLRAELRQLPLSHAQVDGPNLENDVQSQLMEADNGSQLFESAKEDQSEDEQMLATEAAAVVANRSTQDEIISVYEVFVKEDELDEYGLPGKPELTVISALPASGTSQHQFVQDDELLDLDGIDIISADGDDAVDDNEASLTTESERAVAELEALQAAANVSEENMEVYSQSVERPSSTASWLIDKDDPRSRLHYVKYLKRDGKTLKIWECGICSKEFRHQYTLMRHLPTHTDERNFKCDVCGKAFRQLSTLSQHKAIHSDARPYVCEFCKKTFNRVSTLISHRKTHSEHKPHKCHLCGKGFHQKGNLRNHIFTHTNERPYKCDVCCKGFNQMSNLVCHKVKAHAHCEKMQYSCNICGKEFPRRFALRAHEEQKHGIKYRQPPNVQAASDGSKSSKKKSLRIVDTTENDQQNSSLESQDKDINMTEFMENIIIDKIETQAMELALLQGQTPFALFKPAKGIPVLVKVTLNGSSNHLLTPATADDLKISGQMDSSQFSDIDGSKSVQIKVPVVATVTERIDQEGKISFLIEPPGPDQEQDSLLTPVKSVTEVMADNDVDDGNDNDYSQTQPVLNQQTPTPSPTTTHIAATNDEVVELSKDIDIQFVRATGNGGYEVVTSREAVNMMAQNSHDVEIFGTEKVGAINGIISGDFDFLPSIPEKLQNQQTPEVLLPDSNDIVILDPNNDEEIQTFGDLEILANKRVRQIIDAKIMEDQYDTNETGIAYLSQAKIDEILSALKPDPNSNSNAVMSQSQLTSLPNHRSEFPSITTSPLYSHSAQQQEQQQQQQHFPYQPPALQEPIPYSRNNQILNEEFNAIFDDESHSIVDYSSFPEYSTKFRYLEFEDDSEVFFKTDAQSSVKVIAQKNPSLMYETILDKEHYGRISERAADCAFKLSEERMYPTDLSMRYEIGRSTETYEHAFKNPVYDSHFADIGVPPLRSISDIGLEKGLQTATISLESRFFPSEESDNKESEKQNFDDLACGVSFGQNGSAIANFFSNIDNLLERETDKVKMDPDDLLEIIKHEIDWIPKYSPFIFP